jgi:hypothetical protein
VKLVQPTEIEPTYKSISPNGLIELGTHRATLLYGANRGSQGDVSFALRLSPTPRLVGSLHLADYPSTDNITAVELPALSVRFRILTPKVTITGSGTDMVLHPNPEHIEFCLRKPTKLRKVIFQVVNFDDFMGGKNDLTIRTDTVQRRIGRITLSWDGWRITIQAVPTIRSLVETLEEDGGFGVTHVGKIERVRGGRFGVKKASELLDILQLYLSFARGAFVMCPLAAGYDGPDIVWERWSAHIVYPWRYHPGWFSRRPGSLLEDAFPGVAALFKNPHWRRELRVILYWYLRANNTVEGPGVDGGIILSQAALEKLAWVYLVEFRGR